MNGDIYSDQSCVFPHMTVEFSNKLSSWIKFYHFISYFGEITLQSTMLNEKSQVSHKHVDINFTGVTSLGHSEILNLSVCYDIS